LKHHRGQDSLPSGAIGCMTMKNRKYLKDISAYLFLLVVTAYMWTVGIEKQIPIPKVARDQSFKPSTFPRLCFLAIGMFSLLGIVISLMKMTGSRTQEVQNEEEEKRPLGLAPFIPYLTFAAIIIYYILFQHLGWIISTMFCIPLFLLILRCRKISYYLISYAFCAAMYLLFVFVLKVNLP